MNTFDIRIESSDKEIPCLKINLFGVPEVRLNEEIVSGFTSRKVQALLFYLALSKQSCARSTLTGLFWGENSENSARNSLNKAFTNLRKLVPDYVITNRAAASINPDLSYIVDAIEFEKQAYSSVESRDVRTLEKAANLYSGNFLEGFYIEDAPDFEEWVRDKRIRLSRISVSLLSTLIDLQIEQGDFEKAEATGRRSLQLEPWNEHTHQSLMRTLVGAGKRSSALAHYEECCKILERELDTEPSHKTKDLYEEIRSDQIEQLDMPNQRAISDTPIEESIQTSKSNLPTQTTPFVGRTIEMEEIHDLLVDSHSRLITIVAPGGMGKTRLAIEAGAENLNHYKDGVYFVPLVALSDTEQIVENIADILTYSFAPDDRSRKQQLCDYLQNKNILFILDNFEHLLPNIDLLVDLLSGTSAIQFLVTSRERLSLSGETIYTLHGLDWSDDGQLSTETSNVVSLFVQNAQRIRSGYEPNAEDLRAISKIGRLVAGMPLGIILAASWIELLSPAEIAAEIKTGLDLLDAELRDLPERQRSMHTVFEQTWQRLSSVEQDALMRLTVFRESFTREAARHVTHANLKLLKSLVNKSLLRLTPSGRYDIQELLRQFAHEKLMQKSEVESDARQLHSTYYCNWLGEHREDFLWREQLKYYDEIVADIENIRLAWQSAVEGKDVIALDKAWEAYWQFLDWRGVGEEVVWAFESAALMLSSIQDSNDVPDNFIRSLEGVCWTLCGQRLHHRDVAKSFEYTRNGIDLLRMVQPSDTNKLIWGLANLGWVTQCDFGTDSGYTKDMTLDDTRGIFEEALEISKATGNEHGTGAMLNMIGFIYSFADQIDEAEIHLQDGKKILASLGEYRWRSLGLSNLPSISCTKGDYGTARARVDESLEIATLINNRHSMCNALFLKGVLAQAEGNYTDGVRWFSEAIDITLKSGERPLIIAYLAWLANSYWCLEKYRDAEATLEECRVNCHSLHRSTSRYVVGMGRLAYAQGNWEDAERYQRQAIDEFRPAYGDTFDTLLCDLGDTLVARKNPEARQYFIESLQVDKTKRIIPRVLRALAGLSTYYAQFDEIVRAFQLATVVHAHPASWYEHREQTKKIINLAKDQSSYGGLNVEDKFSTEIDLWEIVDSLLVKP